MSQIIPTSDRDLVYAILTLGSKERKVLEHTYIAVLTDKANISPSYIPVLTSYFDEHMAPMDKNGRLKGYKSRAEALKKIGHFWDIAESMRNIFNTEKFKGYLKDNGDDKAHELAFEIAENIIKGDPNFNQYKHLRG